MNNLDKFYDGVITADNRLRTTTYPQLVDFLQNPGTSCACDNIDRFIDGLAAWVNSSNFKVSKGIRANMARVRRLLKYMVVLL